MLRITRIAGSDSETLVLEGKLLEPLLGELRQACARPNGRPICLRLDLSAVTFVDAAGTQLLRELMDQGIAIAACSGFVAVLLHREQS
jgi:ABC-type transporter Mla MlaB component